jgi:cytidine deaminase
METKTKAIKKCLDERLFAVVRKTQVGAALYTKDGRIYVGCNQENRCHKGTHAEEMAVLNAKMHHVNPEDIVGLVVGFSGNTIEHLTFCCGHCRQVVWEYTLNPDLLCIEVDENGKIIKEVTLGELYPYPYPRANQKLKVLEDAKK